MRVKIKPEDLLRYIRLDLSYEQMAEKKEVTKVTIWKHINKIDKDLVNQAKLEGEELRRLEKQKRILGYIRQNLTREEIAKKEGITEVTLWSYIKNNIDEGLLNQAEQDAKELEQIERQKRILGYIRQKLTREEMAKEEGASKVTIWKYIKEIDKELIDKAKNEDEETWQQTQTSLEDKNQQIIYESEERWRELNKENEMRLQQLIGIDEELLNQEEKNGGELEEVERQERILGYIREGLLQKHMAEGEHVSESTISKNIKDIDENLVKQARQEGKERKKIERQERILGYIRENLTYEEMAEKEGVKRRDTIGKYIKEIDEDLIKQAKQEGEERKKFERQERILGYIREGLLQKQIAEKERVLKDTISQYIKEIDENLVKQARQEGKERRKFERQERILEYIREGLLQKQMAEKDGITESTIRRYIKEIDEDLIKKAKQEGEELKRSEREKRILEYIREDLTYEQMAKKEGVSRDTIGRYIKGIDEDLIKQAKQEGKELKRIQKQEGEELKRNEKQKRILGYIRDNLEYEQIAKKEGVSRSTIAKYIKEIDESLVKQAREDAKQLKQIERQKRILGYIREDLSSEQMAEKEGVSRDTIWEYIGKIDQDLVNKAKEEASERRKLEKQERLVRYIRDNLNLEQIAQKEGVSITTIEEHISGIDKDLVKQTRDDVKKVEELKRQKRLLGYVRQNLSYRQIAQKEGVVKDTIGCHVRKIDKNLLNKAKEEDDESWELEEQAQTDKIQQILYRSEARWQNLVQEYEARWKKEEQEQESKFQQLIDESETRWQALMEKYEKPKNESITPKTNSRVTLEKSKITNYEDKLVKIMRKKIKSKTITKKDIDIYKERLDEKYDEMKYEELTLLIKAYIETNQIEEAIRFLNSIIYNRDMAYLGVEKLNQLKTSVEQIKKEQYACSLIESGNKTAAEIAQIVRFKGNRDYKNKK